MGGVERLHLFDHGAESCVCEQMNGRLTINAHQGGATRRAGHEYHIRAELGELIFTMVNYFNMTKSSTFMGI